MREEAKLKREEEKRKNEENKKVKGKPSKGRAAQGQRGKKRRIVQESDDDSSVDDDHMSLDDDSDDAGEFDADKCAKCLGVDDGSDPNCWIGCSNCPRWWHKACAHVDLDLTEEEVAEMFFECDYC